MPEFCDVALPVPLDMVFTYCVSADAIPVVGGRVLVPFGQRRMTGIVVELHDRKPSVKTKTVLSVLDTSPVLDQQLVRLGRWIADYYLAPLGEVFRTMLPLNAEFKRAIAYRISAEGRMALHMAGTSGSPGRSRRTPDEQAAEFRVLDYLAGHESASGEAAPVREEALRTATGVSKLILSGMVRKKWMVREDVSDVRDATRTIKIAQLKSSDGKLNDNQRQIVDTLAASGGRVPVETLQALDVPRTTLSTLVKRGLTEIIEEPAAFDGLAQQAAAVFRIRFQSSSAKRRSIDCAKPWTRERSPAFFCTALLGRGKPPFISQACVLFLKPGDQRFFLSLKSALRLRSPPICTRFSATKSPFCIPHFPTKSARSSGIALRAETRAWLSVRAPRSSLRFLTWR